MEPAHLLRGVFFVMAPLTQTLFSDASYYRGLHLWELFYLRGLVSRGEGVSYQPPENDGCLSGSSVLSAGIDKNSSVSNVVQFESGGLLVKLGGTCPSLCQVWQGEILCSLMV